jgi:hypothetical protein
MAAPARFHDTGARSDFSGDRALRRAANLIGLPRNRALLTDRTVWRHLMKEARQHVLDGPDPHWTAKLAAGRAKFKKPARFCDAFAVEM